MVAEKYMPRELNHNNIRLWQAYLYKETVMAHTYWTNNPEFISDAITFLLDKGSQYKTDKHLALVWLSKTIATHSTACKD